MYINIHRVLKLLCVFVKYLLDEQACYLFQSDCEVAYDKRATSILQR